MCAYLLRSACPDDLEDVAALWQTAFRDPAPLVRRLLTEGALLQQAVVAEADGRAAAVMFAFSGLEIGGRSAAYLYALCTLPAYRGRGLGAAVLNELSAQCFAQGTEMVFLSPADAGLSRWYQTLGFAPLGGMSDAAAALSPGPAGSCVPIGIHDYVNLTVNTVPMTPALLQAQLILLEHSGGGLFRLALSGGSAAACALPTAQGLLILALCCPKAMEAEALRTLAAHFSTEALLLRCIGGDMELLYRCKEGAAPVRPGGLCFPFLLDK